jgi:TP901 family phage tail tape measure protein
MPPQATVNINANVSPAQAAIQKLINQQYNLNLNLSTKGGQPLGKITGQVSEFNKSLDAANARVVAFGASATVLFGLNKAFEALVTSTIEVQKSLADINVILNVSDKQINQFGSSLFNVAKNTGQSFQEVAKAATEFSRQGLGVEETLKRTSEALILSRLSGLDTVKSVEALTAAVNSFASQSVTATQIVNKFATVDAAFAVSSADLAEAISRVGSSASQSGVQLDELIGLVTSAQQTTARGGAVIGNSFKTIFTRLQRGKVVDLLGSLGIETTNATGELRSTIDLLKDLGKVYDTLGSQQQASVAEAVGGVFQINILKAALADLGKEYSVYNNAVQISSTATNEAITRNDQLNKTLAAQINALKQNATQFAAKSGESLFGPALENLVGGGNSLLESLNNVDSESVGGKIGNGILKGIGDIIAGPGLALIGGVLLKLFGDFAKFSAGSVKELLGLNSAANQQQGIQSSISAILAKNPQIYQQMASGALSVNQASQVLLTVLQQQTAQMQQQSALTSQISKNLYGAGVRVPKGSQTAVTTKAAGYIPNFVDPYAMEEAQAKALGARSPRAQLSKGTIGGKKFIKNSEELEIPRFGKNGDSAVIPMYSRGYIPNFANSQEIVKSKEYSVSEILKRSGGAFRNSKNADMIDTFQSDVKIIRQAKTNSQYFGSAGGVFNNIFKKWGSGTGKQTDANFLNKQLKEYRLAGVDPSSIKSLEQSINNAQPVKDSNKNTQTRNNIVNKIKGIQGEIDAARMLNTKISSGNAFVDLVSGEEVKTRGSQEIWQLVKKSANSYLSTNNIAKNGANGRPKKDAIKTPMSVVLPSDGKLVNYANGYIPNFAETFAERLAKSRERNLAKNAGRGSFGRSGANAPEITKTPYYNNKPIPLPNQNKIGLIHAGVGGGLVEGVKGRFRDTRDGQRYDIGIDSAGIDPDGSNPAELSVVDIIEKNLVTSTNDYASRLFKRGAVNVSKEDLLRTNPGAVKGIVGNAFEAVISAQTGSNLFRKSNEGIDYENVSSDLRKIFYNIPSKTLEAKYSSDLIDSVAEKGYTKGLFNDTIANAKKGVKANKAAGYIPNFAERVGIVTGDVIRGNEYKEVLQYLANTTKPISTILGPAGVGKTTRASQMGGQLLKSFAEINKFDKFILDRAGFDVPQKDVVTAANIRKIFAKSNAAGSLDVLFGSRNTVSSLRDKRLQEGDKIIGERNNLKGGSGGVGSFTKGIRGFMGEYGNANVLRMRKSGEQYGLSKVNFASGYIPNFANALNESISREIGAGAPKSGIYTKQYSQLASSSNPLGIGVFNKRDEGTRQKEKSAMSRRGYATGYIPNFAEGDAGGSDVGKTVAAIGVQLASFAGIMAFQIPQIKQSYQEEIATRKAALVKTIQEETNARRNSIAEEISSRRDAMSQLSAAQTQQQQQLQQEIAVLSAEGKKLRADTNKKTKTIEAGGAEVLSAKSRRGARLQAAGGALSTAATFAPIIAETAASSVDTSTREGRTKSAAITGAGTALSAAGTGALVGSALGPIGTAVGAGLGLAVGTITAFNNVVKEATTDLPELIAAAKKTSEEQARLGEVTGQVIPKLEQLQALREGGNANSREAVNLEKQIREIASTAPEAVQKAISAGGLDFTKTNKLLADLNVTMGKQLAKQNKQGTGQKLVEQLQDGKIGKSEFNEAISKQGVSDKTDEELKALISKFSQAKVSSQDLVDALGLTEQNIYDLDLNGPVDEVARTLLEAAKKEAQIRQDGARDTAKDFAEKNAEAVKAIQDFEAALRKAISSQDLSTRSSIASSGAAFASEFKRQKSDGDVGILQALGYDKAASNLQTKNIYDNTIGAQKTESSAAVDDAIKQYLIKSSPAAIPSTTGITDLNDYNDRLKILGDLSGKSGNQDFVKKIKDDAAKISDIPMKSLKGAPLGTLEQYDTDAIISQLEKNGGKDAEELNKVRETLNNNNKLLFDAQKQAATETLKSIDELIKVTIAGLSSLGGSIDDMLNDGGMGDGSASEKFSEATTDYLAVMKDPKATAEQKGQAARDLLKAEKNLGMEVKTDDPVYKVLESALAQIGESQRKVIEDKLKNIGQGGRYNERVAQLGGIEKAAQVKTSVDIRPADPLDPNKIAKLTEDQRNKQAKAIATLGPEGKALEKTVTAASANANAAPAGITALGDIFKSQIDTSNGHLNDMVSILGRMETNSLPSRILPQDAPRGNLFSSMSVMGVRDAYMGNNHYDKIQAISRDNSSSTEAQVLGYGQDPYMSTAGTMRKIEETKALATAKDQTRAESDFYGAIGQPVPASPINLTFNAPITATSTDQGKKIEYVMQGIEKDLIENMSSRLTKVESVTAATVVKDPSLTPPPTNKQAALKFTEGRPSYGAMGGFGAVQ